MDEVTEPYYCKVIRTHFIELVFRSSPAKYHSFVFYSIRRGSCKSAPKNLKMLVRRLLGVPAIQIENCGAQIMLLRFSHFPKKNPGKYSWLRYWSSLFVPYLKCFLTHSSFSYTNVSFWNRVIRSCNRILHSYLTSCSFFLL